MVQSWWTSAWTVWVMGHPQHCLQMTNMGAAAAGTPKGGAAIQRDWRSGLIEMELMVLEGTKLS